MYRHASIALAAANAQQAEQSPWFEIGPNGIPSPTQLFDPGLGVLDRDAYPKLSRVRCHPLT